MWLFSDGQGNFDPLRQLWSETPFNRSPTQEFKLILSLPTTTSLLRFRVEAKALPSCQSCWQPGELKALSNADDQCEWLAANGLLTLFFFFWSEGMVGVSLLHSKTGTFLYFFTSKLWSFQMILFALVFLRLLLRPCDSLLYVARLLKSLTGCSFPRRWIGLDLQHRSCEVTEPQQPHKGTEMWLKTHVTRQKHKRVLRDVFTDSPEEILKASSLGDLFAVSTSHYSDFFFVCVWAALWVYLI